jgi:hypothetical protein
MIPEWIKRLPVTVPKLDFQEYFLLVRSMVAFEEERCERCWKQRQAEDIPAYTGWWAGWKQWEFDHRRVHCTNIALCEWCGENHDLQSCKGYEQLCVSLQEL